jgi:hypothetical protein
MNALLILFFSSLLGIAIMLGRKIVFAPHGEMFEEDYEHPFVPDIEKIKALTLHHTKRYGHKGLVTTLRLYLKSRHLLKNTYEVSKEKIKNLNTKNGTNGEVVEKVEVSKFLKAMSAYKNRIRAIKRKIKEEENL